MCSTPLFLTGPSHHPPLHSPPPSESSALQLCHFLVTFSSFLSFRNELHTKTFISTYLWLKSLGVPTLLPLFPTLTVDKNLKRAFCICLWSQNGQDWDLRLATQHLNSNSFLAGKKIHWSETWLGRFYIFIKYWYSNFIFVYTACCFLYVLHKVGFLQIVLKSGVHKNFSYWCVIRVYKCVLNNMDILWY